MKKVLAAIVMIPSMMLAQGSAPVTGVGTAAMTWQGNMKWITMAADQMSEADYAFKPTAGVRSFGDLIGHVAGAQHMFCAAVLGDKMTAEDDIEKNVHSKAGLVAALKASNEYCGRAYKLTDADAAATVKLFGSDMSKMYVLMLNSTHIAEHYGNIVTYMRMKSMVPPSSQPAAGQ
ncbi:MAG TPA: DinB family protein [Nitrospiraceae bacterium]|nr:DinB family protein [Nitrospiraceae bacterium]